MLTTEGRTTRWNYADVDHAAEDVTPLYDNLLVKRLDWPETRGILIDPMIQQTADGRWVRKSDEGPRRGLVVAAGRGDRRKHRCPSCKHVFHPDTNTWDGYRDAFPCPKCRDFVPCGPPRMQMAVKVGDIIIYPRFESTHVEIRGEKYTFCHEGDVMAVVDAE